MSCWRYSVVATTVLGLASLSSGCAGNGEATKKQIGALQDKVAILQNERDRLEERVSALEQQQQVLVASAQSDAVPSSDRSRPPLKVVRLEPPMANVGEAPTPAVPAPATAATEPRVLISGSGDDLQATVVEAAQ